MKHPRAILAAIAAVLALGGCATMEGAKQDVKSGADTVKGWFN